LEGTPRAIIEAAGEIGLFLVSPAFLLAALALLIYLLTSLGAAQPARSLERSLLAFLLAAVGSFAVVHVLFAKAAWIDTTLNLLSLLAIVSITLIFVFSPDAPVPAKIAVSLVAAGYTGQFLYVLHQLVGGGSSGLAAAAVSARDLGELAALSAPYAFFAAIALPGGEWKRKRRWIVPVLLAGLFAAGSIADMVFNQGFTAVFSTWSLGFNLIWPWPLYAVGLALFGYSVLTCFRRSSAESGYANPDTGLGLLLLFFAGFELKVPYQHLLTLLSLLALAGLFRPLAVSEASAATPMGVTRGVASDGSTRAG
jgi:hypothetical protein